MVGLQVEAAGERLEEVRQCLVLRIRVVWEQVVVEEEALADQLAR